MCFDEGEPTLHTEHASLAKSRYIMNIPFIMEYLIQIVFFSTSFSKSVSKTRMNLLRDLKVPLFAELDVSNVQNYIATKIDTRLDHINDTLDDKIEALMDDTMTVDNLDETKLENDERVSGFISDLKSLEEIEKNLKNLKNENNQLKEDFMEWKNNGKWYYRLYLLFDVLF
jgi:hypothetical protein